MVVWNVVKGERIIEVGEETDAVLAADISPDQTQIALGGPSKVVRLYSTKDGKLQQRDPEAHRLGDALEFSPDGVLLATGDRNGGLFVWEAFTGAGILLAARPHGGHHRGELAGGRQRLRLGQRGRHRSALGDGERQADQELGSARRRRSRSVTHGMAGSYQLRPRQADATVGRQRRGAASVRGVRRMWRCGPHSATMAAV